MPEKKDLAIVLGTSGNMTFALANVLIGLQKHSPQLEKEILIYEKDISEKDKELLNKIVPCNFIKYKFPVTNPTMYEQEYYNRFTDLAFSRYECFRLLDKYKKVVWLDIDILIQKDISEMCRETTTGACFSQGPNTVGSLFTKIPDANYDWNRKFYDSGTFIIDEKLPHRHQIADWLYETTNKFADCLHLSDQSILNIMFQEFNLDIQPLDRTKYVCHPTKKYVKDAHIVHSYSCEKFWNFWPFPEWYENHDKWVKMGGNSPKIRKGHWISRRVKKKWLQSPDPVRKPRQFFAFLIEGIKNPEILKEGRTTVKKEKIAVLSNTFPPFSGGGISTAQYNLFNKLKEKGFEVKGFTFYDHGKSNLQEKDIIRYGSPKFIFRVINSLTKNYFSKPSKKDCATSNEYAWQWNFTLNSAIGCWKINKQLKKFNPDIIIMPDLGTPNYYIKKPDKKCRSIMISHHNAMRFLKNPLIDKHSELDAKFVNDLENKGLKGIDKVICPSNYMKEFFEQTHNGYNKHIDIIPNIINEKLIEKSPKLDIRNKIDLPEDAPLIYIPAANTPVKGPRYIFEIIRRLANYYKKRIGFYLSAGTTEELNFELNYIPKNAKIYSPGFLKYSENIGTIKACNFGITPALLESFGMAVLEGHLSGVPFVSFDCGGNSDVINDGEDGFLVDYLNVETLIDKAQLLLSNKDLRQEMGQKARLNALNNFNSDKVINKFIEVITH